VDHCHYIVDHCHYIVDHCHYAHRQVVLACLLCSQIMASYTERAGLIRPASERAASGYSRSALCCMVIRRLVLKRCSYQVEGHIHKTWIFINTGVRTWNNAMIAWLLFLFTAYIMMVIWNKKDDLCDPPETWFTIILTCLTQQLLVVHQRPFEDPQVVHIVKNVLTFLRSQKLIFLFKTFNYLTLPFARKFVSYPQNLYHYGKF
jgi:hypothetical protein